MPSWVTTGWQEYAKRLPKHFALNLIEIAPIHRAKNANIDQIKAHESNSLWQAIPNKSLTIALDENGKCLSTELFASKMNVWQENYRDISFLIGGPDGISQEILSQCDVKLSLSTFTLPHPLVRVIFAEQIYRAYSIIKQHPYHRE